MVNKVIFDCERMKYENTGLSQYCLNLGSRLQYSIDTAEESLHFYCPFEKQSLFGKQHCLTQSELHKYRMPPLNNYQVWHATYQGSDYLPFRDRRIRVVLTIHDLNFLYDERKSGPKKERYLRRLQQLIDRADAIVCVSEYSRKDVYFHCNTYQKPVYTIYNGTNTLQEPFLQRHSYRPVLPFIFSLGTISPKKNFHSLLPLVQNQSVELLIAGPTTDESYRQYIHEQASEMNVSKRVKLLGQISENEKSWYLNNCYAFAFPSTAEGFGLPVAEAMSVGKPLFLSGSTALPEIGGEVAFYFDNFSAPHMQERFITGMKQYVRLNMQQEIINKGKSYCWDLAAREYWKVYRSLY